MVDQGKLKPLNRMYSDRKMQTLQRDHDVRGYLDDFLMRLMLLCKRYASHLICRESWLGKNGRKTILIQVCKIISSKRKMATGSNSFAFLRRRWLVEIACTSTRLVNNLFLVWYIGVTSLQYTSTISRYNSSKTSVSTDEVSPANILSPGVPPTEKEQSRSALQASQAQLDRLHPDLGAAQGAFDVAQREAQERNADWVDKKRRKEIMPTPKGKLWARREKTWSCRKRFPLYNRKEKKKMLQENS